jgi:hypothetical protein
MWITPRILTERNLLLQGLHQSGGVLESRDSPRRGTTCDSPGFHRRPARGPI